MLDATLEELRLVSPAELEAILSSDEGTDSDSLGLGFLNIAAIAGTDD